MILWIDAENTHDKIQHLFINKTLNKRNRDTTFLNSLTATANIPGKSERPELSSRPGATFTLQLCATLWHRFWPREEVGEEKGHQVQGGGDAVSACRWRDRTWHTNSTLLHTQSHTEQLTLVMLQDTWRIYRVNHMVLGINKTFKNEIKKAIPLKINQK